VGAPRGQPFSPGRTRIELTLPENGVWFDLAIVGHPQKWSRTSATAQDGFLALDRNDDGLITDGTELFGSYTPQPPSASPNDFLALGVYDKSESGVNDDGFRDAQDKIYSKLRIWIDSNHNGVSEPSELHTLREIGIARIDLQYQVGARTDQFGLLPGLLPRGLCFACPASRIGT
jgi:hypothetical protein